MYLERLLQINMATLAAMGALLLGMGQRSEGPPLVVTLAAAMSIWLTDITSWFRIGQRTANVLMLVASAATLYEVFPMTNELQTLGFARFVIYLQIILLFREKDQRVYWLLVMLSLLQVVVATLFSQGVWFGVLLAIYMLFGFSAMTLLLFYRQWRHYRPKETTAPAVQTTSRWPLTSQLPEFYCVPGSGSRSGLGRELFGRLGRMGLHSLALALVLFFAVPRFGQTTWRGAVGNPQPMVGYSDTVTLGSLGQVIEDSSEVMQVQFYDPKKGDRRPITSEIYLHGAILMTYEDGRWQAGLPSWNTRTELLDPAETLPKSGMVWQEIKIEGMDHEELFFVPPFIPLESTIDISIDHGRGRLLRLDQIRQRQFWYRLGTTAIVNGVQKPLVPRIAMEATKDRALQLPQGDGSKSLPKLRALAKQWIEASGLPEEDRVGRARYLEQMLASSGDFQYSLHGIERNLDIDPIEDFVSEHRQGHCEYFATALALMLRSQGIPARVIVGYKCDEWNPARQCYQVRQLHAHTWVEVYLRSYQIPPNLLHGLGYWPWLTQGAWLRLDPTPGGASSSRQPHWFAPVRDSMDWLDARWTEYVTDLDAQTQRDAIYGPIVQAAKAVYSALTNPETWHVFLAEWAARLHLDQITSTTGRLLAGFAAIIAIAIILGLGWLGWFVGRRLWMRWTGKGARHTRLAEIEFYRRFETLLARRGIHRGAGQTQREFAETAGNRVALDTDNWRLAPLPGVVVDAFYRVRFGHKPLDNPDAETVEQAIRKLTEGLS